MAFKFPETDEQLSQAKLPRRLVSMLYDFLICVALMMVTTGLYMAVASKLTGNAEYKAAVDAGKTIGDPMLSSVLFITLYFFFAYFWTHTGQTLGMQVWHIRVQNKDGSSLSFMQALLRFLMAGVSIAAFGLGYFWMLFDKQGRTWQCIFSETQIVRIPKRNSK